ncbi:hypothetical protein [Methylobrevis pamukkalensis]|uniref:hypothetical protein n=1 Tax=Methylobrevis pamukkalensis TaxID=1439726 RepID=UPI000845E40D|nr:hypothetical protein [Methylobrevis pamukkalensis]
MGRRRIVLDHDANETAVARAIGLHLATLDSDATRTAAAAASQSASVEGDAQDPAPGQDDRAARRRKIRAPKA